MSPDKLSRMANQIAAFFKNRAHDEAVAGIAAHISDFWEPRMRKQFFALISDEPDRFDPLVHDAAKNIRPVDAD